MLKEWAFGKKTSNFYPLIGHKQGLKITLRCQMADWNLITDQDYGTYF